MLLIWLIFIIPYVFCNKDDLPTNDTLKEIERINNLPYSHDSTVSGHNADFSFKITNTSYATDVLEIDSYYYSITYIDKHRHERRVSISNLTNEDNEFEGKLLMEHLEEGNYLICVIFVTQTNIVSSSRFCHVISVHAGCSLETSESMASNQQVYVLTAFVVFILAFVIIFTCIRDFYYRPRTIDAILRTLPQHHANNLETLAPTADARRQRRTEPSLNEHLREASVHTIYYEPNADDNYHSYHNRPSLAVVTEYEETD